MSIREILKSPLKIIPKGTRVPFLFQPSLKGAKWIIGSGPHGCWLGTAERVKRGVFTKKVERGNVILDIGANVGYYSLMASRLVGPEGVVHAFEPSPRNIRYALQHFEINDIKNVCLNECAVSSKSGNARFDASIDPVTQRISKDGGIEVKTITVDDYVRQTAIGKVDVIKIDVEGHEIDVLRGAKEVLRYHKPKVFVETHDRFVPGIHEECEKFLLELGFVVEVLEPCELYANC